MRHVANSKQSKPFRKRPARMGSAARLGIEQLSRAAAEHRHANLCDELRFQYDWKIHHDRRRVNGR